MEKWLEQEIQNKWKILNSNPKMLNELFGFANNNQSISTMSLRNRTEIIILESMRRKETDIIKRRTIEEAIQELIDKEEVIEEKLKLIR